MDYKEYIDKLEFFNKELEDTRSLVNKSRKQYWDTLDDFKSSLKTFYDNNARNEFTNRYRIILEETKDNLRMLESQERILLTEKQDLTLTYQIISNRNSSRQQRWLTAAIIFIGFISLLNTMLSN